MDEIYEQVAREFGIDKRLVKKLYEGYWGYIRYRVGLCKYDDRLSFFLRGLGRLYTTRSWRKKSNAIRRKRKAALHRRDSDGRGQREGFEGG